MSTPPKATPTTPQWAIAAAKELTDSMTNGVAWNGLVAMRAAIIAKHAPPPAAQPSDAAGLREVIQCAVVFGGECDDLPANKARVLIDRILTALAPYLKGEPGDSELLDWLDKHHNWILCAESESPTFSCGSNENFQNWALKVPTVRAAIRAAIKSAQRGEGKP